MHVSTCALAPSVCRTEPTRRCLVVTRVDRAPVVDASRHRCLRIDPAGANKTEIVGVAQAAFGRVAAAAVGGALPRQVA